MKDYFKTQVILLLSFLFCFNLFAQKDDYIVGKKIKNSQLLGIQKEDVFIDAEYILSEVGTKLDLTNGKVFYFAKDEFEVKFPILDSKNKYDYKTFVYANKKGEIYSYFEDKNMAFKSVTTPKPSNSTNFALFGNCSWSGWQMIPNYSECLDNWWCGKKNNRKATYHMEENIKKCYSHGSYYIRKIKNRRIKDYCGC